MSAPTSNDSSALVYNTPKAAEQGGSNAISYPYPVIGVVKDNIDPDRSGTLGVWLEGVENPSLDPDKGPWIKVKFLSPFMGHTSGDAGEDTYGNYKLNPSSYGMWFSQPDIGSKVLCMFAGGKPDQGYWIGSPSNALYLDMIPAIGGKDYIIPNDAEAKTMGDALRLPATGVNANNPTIAKGNTFLEEPRPVHSYTAAILQQQGLIKDPIRGVIGSNSQRESPSRVGWGVSTPGRPIYSGGYDDKTITSALDPNVNPQQLKTVSRRGGHTIVMDDGDIIGRDQLIRIRTAGGHMVLMSDDGQVLTIMHSNGQSYVELGKEGTIDMYSTNSINLRSQGDINLHADRDVNINGNKNTRVNSNDNLELNSSGKTKHFVGKNYELSCGMIMTLKGGLGLALDSGGVASLSGSMLTFVKGKLLMLNSMSSPLIARDVKGSDIQTHVTNIWTADKGIINLPDGVASVCSRIPCHMPWNESNKGVDVNVDLSQNSGLPSAPDDAVSSLTSKLGGLTEKLQSGILSNIPGMPNLSNNLTGAVAGGMFGAQAQVNANSPFSASNAAGFAIAAINGKREIKIGPAGMTPDQLEAGGIIKPGSAAKIAQLIAAGKPPQMAFSSSVFTGNEGVKSFSDLISNTNQQAQAAGVSYQKSQTELISTGLISGTSSPSVEAGLVLSAATQGTQKTINTLNQLVPPNSSFGGKLDSIQRSLNVVNNTITQTMSLGNQAGGLATNPQDKPTVAAIGALQEDPQYQGKVSFNRGVIGAAFDTVMAGIGQLEAGQPVNLSQQAALRGNPTSFAPFGSAFGPGGIASAQSPFNSLFNFGPSSKGGVRGAVNNLAAAAGNNAKNAFLSGFTDANKAGAGFGASFQYGLSAGTSSLQSAFGFGAKTGTGGFGITGQGGPFFGQGGPAGFLNNAAGGFLNRATGGLFGKVQGAGGIAGITNTLSGASALLSAGNLTGSLNSLATGLGPLGGGKLQTLNTAVQTIQGSIASFQAAGGIAGAFSGIKAAGMLGKAGQFGLAQNALSVGLTPAIGSMVNIAGAVASIASLFGGKRKIRKGVSKEKTVARSGIDTQIIATLGDPGIPPPLFITGVSDAQVQALEAAKAAAKQQALSKGQNNNNSTSAPNSPSSNPSGNSAALGRGQNVPLNPIANEPISEDTRELLAKNYTEGLERNIEIGQARFDFEQIKTSYPQGSFEIGAAKNILNNLITTAQAPIAAKPNNQTTYATNGVATNQEKWNKTKSPTSLSGTGTIQGDGG